MKVYRSGRVASLLLAGALVGFLGGIAADRTIFRSRAHSVIRERAILSQADQFREGGSVIFGDSIVEFALLDPVCGRPILNAGVRGALLDDVIRLSEVILARKAFDTVIVAVGVNDAEWGKPRKIQLWLQNYEMLLQRIQRHQVRRVYVKAIDPVEPGKPFGDKTFDQSFINLENDGLADLSKKYDAQFVRPPASMTGQTGDGVHPSASGYTDLRKRLGASIECS